MSIRKMKKIRLIMSRSQKEQLLKELMILGCVEVSEIPKDELNDSIDQFMVKESSDLSRYRSQYAELTHAVQVFDKYAPKKKKLLSARPEVSQEMFLDSKHFDRTLVLADEITDYDDRIKRITAEQSRIKSNIEGLKPWSDSDIPLECHGTKTTVLLSGTVPALVDVGALIASVKSVTDEAEVFLISEDKDTKYLQLICFNNDEQQIAQILQTEYSFTPSVNTEFVGTAKDNIEKFHAKLKELQEEKQSLIDSVASMADKEPEFCDNLTARDCLKLGADRLYTDVGEAEAEDKMYGMSSVIAFEGWVPEEKQSDVTSVLDRYNCAYEFSDPTPDEYSKVPVSLKNNKITNALNMVTNMYSLPAYDSVDPNPLMAPFFILFYGIMLADMGYGLLMIIAALLVIKKTRPRPGTLCFAQLMLYCGISTFIMGILTGSFFSDAPYQIVHMINPNSTWGGLWSLFSPLNDSIYILIGAMCLGIIQLNTGLVVSFIKKIRRGQIVNAILYEGSMWVMLVGIILLVLKLTTVGWIIFIAGLCMLFAGSMMEAKGIGGKILSIFVAIYNEATGWFGDILSYSRIMALMLAGSVIGQVFNTIGAITGNIFTFIIIFLIGHTLNFALNLLGCYVHDLRLQCLEYFGKFYEDGGKPFNPLAINTNYYDIAK
jgi:V/A-type H+-transporting ATPase subunit I